jgi:hypothetical protein
MNERLDGFGAVLLVFAAISIVTGLAMAFATGTFFEEIAPYEPRSDHFIRDLATYSFASGVVFAIAAYRRSWRLPVLVYATLQYGLHAVNHLVDIDETDPERLGITAFVYISVGAVVLGALLWRTRQ